MKSARLLELEVVGVVVGRGQDDRAPSTTEANVAKLLAQIRLALEAARQEGHEKATTVDLGTLGFVPNKVRLMYFVGIAHRNSS